MFSVPIQSQNLTQLGNSTVDVYYGEGSSLYANMTRLVGEVLALNASLSLGMPASQNSLMGFLGPRSVCVCVSQPP